MDSDEDFDDDESVASAAEADLAQRNTNAQGGVNFARTQITKLSKWSSELFTPEEVEEIKASHEMRTAERFGDFRNKFMRAREKWNEEVANYPDQMRKATTFLMQAESKLKSVKEMSRVKDKLKALEEVERLTTQSWSVAIMADNEMEFAYNRLLVAAVLSKEDVAKLARPQQQLESRERRPTQPADPWAGDWTDPEYYSDEEQEATQLAHSRAEAATQLVDSAAETQLVDSEAETQLVDSEAGTQLARSQAGRSRGAYQRVQTRSPAKTQLAQGSRSQLRTPLGRDGAASQADTEPVASQASEELKQFATQLNAELFTDVKQFVTETKNFSFDISLDPGKAETDAAIHELSRAANETPYERAAAAVRNVLQEGNRIARSVLELAEPRSRKAQDWEEFSDRVQSVQVAMRNAIDSFNGFHHALENAFKKIVTQKARHIALGHRPRFPPRRGSQAARRFQEMHFQVQPERTSDRGPQESTQRQRAAEAFTSLQTMATDFIKHTQMYEFPENLEPNREEVDAAIDELTSPPDETPYRQSVAVARNASADTDHIVNLAVRLTEPFTDSKLEWERFVDQVRSTRTAFEAAKDQFSLARANMKEQHAKIIRLKALHEAMDWLNTRPPQRELNFSLSQRKR